jgi:hypothetical protein
MTNPGNMSSQETVLYFAYDPSISREVMTSRYRTAKYVGLGCLRNAEWYICEHQKANIHARRDVDVWGLVYKITAEDEANYNPDTNGKKNGDYVKANFTVEYWAVNTSEHGTSSNNTAPANCITAPDEASFGSLGEKTGMIVYRDTKCTVKLGKRPDERYIEMSRSGIAEGILADFPQHYLCKLARMVFGEFRSRDLAHIQDIANKAGTTTEVVRQRLGIKDEEGDTRAE